MTPLEILSLTFREIEIPASTPSGPSVGVYLLVDDDEIVYVGASLCVETRVHAHRTAKTDFYTKQFDRAFALSLPAGALAHYEGALIRALHPHYNYGAPAHADGYDNEILDGFGLPVHLDEQAAVLRWRKVQRRRRADRAGIRCWHGAINEAKHELLGDTP